MPTRAWFQLVFLLVALVLLLLFMSQIGQRSAGCFQQITTEGDAGAPAAVPPTGTP